jgi:hypothetical protein
VKALSSLSLGSIKPHLSKPLFPTHFCVFFFIFFLVAMITGLADEEQAAFPEAYPQILLAK